MIKDKILAKLIKQETERQQKTVNLIPSENIVSQDILDVLGSPLTNKYSEGYPGKRYYAGNQYYDQIEILAQKRLLKLFKLTGRAGHPDSPVGEEGSQKNYWHVNVQPYSGTPANLEIYFALMDPGETLMGMSLAAGGHLSHGHKVSASGRIYKSIQYGVDSQTGLLDYDALEKLAYEHRPRLIISGHSAYPRRIDFQRIGVITKKVGAFHVADISHIAGLVAAGLHPSPFALDSGGLPCADIVMTTTHKTLRGPRGAIIFCRSEYKERIDRAVFPGMQGGPHNNIIAAIALMAQEASLPSFKKYQQQVLKNASALSETLKLFGFKLLTNGTDNHLLLIDLKTIPEMYPAPFLDRKDNTAKQIEKRCGVDGKRAQNLLEEAGIVVNRNSIPGDASPFNPTGIRIGAPAVTTRGMKEKEMKIIANWFKRILIDKEKPAVVKKEVEALCAKLKV